MTAFDDALTVRRQMGQQMKLGRAKLTDAIRVGVSEYAGPHDPGTPSVTGYMRNDLRLGAFPDLWAAAELSTNPHDDPGLFDFRAILMLVPIEQRKLIMAQRVLGADPARGLPHRWPFVVHIDGLTSPIYCQKLDIGAGGDPVTPGGPPRAVDLFYAVTAWFGLSNVRTGPWSGNATIRVALP